ncbi:H-NS histone family protein [Vibrio harveyi]|uniref:H-NS histone family protein n=1 Tax=Vibrio harveyi TaxID=669 RepID=UPI002481324A|nr:H-NS histone family protein [Vibrio harveyi]
MAHAIVTMMTKLSSLRKFATDSGLTKAEKQKIVDNLLILIEEDQEEESRLNREQQEQQKLVEKYRSILDELGISVEELRALLTIKSSPNSQPPKYYFVEQGELKTWSGRGRIPNTMKKQIESGRSLESFAIRTVGNGK